MCIPLKAYVWHLVLCVYANDGITMIERNVNIKDEKKLYNVTYMRCYSSSTGKREKKNIWSSIALSVCYCVISGDLDVTQKQSVQKSFILSKEVYISYDRQGMVILGKVLCLPNIVAEYTTIYWIRVKNFHIPKKSHKNVVFFGTFNIRNAWQ